MLLIEKGKKSHLPKKYRSVNNLCAVIYDQFTGILKSNIFLSHTKVEFAIDPAKQQLVNELFNDSVHALDFLKANGLDDELTDMLTKHITLSVLGDFVNFIYESISCAQRGKMSVAYALLRKPLTDELLIFEQLLYDRADFVRRFFHVGDPKQYDPGLANLDRKQIITNVFTKAQPNGFFNAELIYNLRYDKNTPSGLNGITNRALHIVTTHPSYRTDDQELNFVFSNTEDYHRYWQHYFYFVPVLLIYSAMIVDELVFGWMPGFEDLKAVRDLQRMIGLLNWSRTMQTGRSAKKYYKAMVTAFAQQLDGPCEACGKEREVEEADFNLFFNELVFLCPHCLHDHLASPEFVDRIKALMAIVQGKAET